MNKKPARGFTLVELLVVITIIAVLSVIGLTVFTSSQKLGRDARRRGDLQAIAQALEQYKAQNGSYPNPNYQCWSSHTDCWDLTSLKLSGFIQDIPKDPVNYDGGACNNSSDTSDTCHIYQLSGDGSYYCLSANLESGTSNGRNSDCGGLSGGHLLVIKNQQ